METWLRGGVGRAQGGYDEMVFRAMVQDEAKFYDPLGLVSKGTEIDFKTGANAYLYGTRFMDYLALDLWPAAAARLVAARTQPAGAITPMISSASTACPSTSPGATGSRGSTASSKRISPAVREHPITGYHDLTRQDLGGVSRGCLSAGRFHGSTWASSIPGRSRTWYRSTAATARSPS